MMKRVMLRSLIALAVVPTLLGGAGCARMYLSSAQLNNHVQLNPTSEPIKKHFEESRWNHYFLFQLVPTARPKISDMLASHVAAGDKVVGLQVKKKTILVNGLICVLVGFIYCPDTLVVEGDVVIGAADAPVTKD
jgi:hypothetical protein